MGNPRNRFYFKPKRPFGGIFFVLWGVLAAVMGLDTQDTFFIFWGGFLLLIGILLLVVYAKSRVSGQGLDQSLSSYAETVLPEAIAFFGLDGSCHPAIALTGYFFHRMPGQLPVAKYGKDGIPRTDIGVCQLCFLWRERLYCYQKQFSLTSNDSHVETMVLTLSEVAEISGEEIHIACKTPRGENIQVPAGRLMIRSGDGEAVELQISQGAAEAAVQLQALVGLRAGQEESL